VNKMSTIKLYRHPLSGHAHRVELFLSILGLDAEMIDVDLMKGEQQQADFLQKNIFGQVPVLEDGSVTIADSNAILVYLADQYDQEHTWLPTTPAAAAEVQRFLSVAAGPIAAGPATARLINLFGAKLDHAKTIEKAHDVLSKLDKHLQDREWLAGNHPTIADLANYTYIAHAPEGDVPLQDYPNIRTWLQSVGSIPGFVPMQSSAVGLAA
jgi:glutathione S-transferase